MYAQSRNTYAAIARYEQLPLPATMALSVFTGLVFLLDLYPAPLWNVIVAAVSTPWDTSPFR